MCIAPLITFTLKRKSRTKKKPQVVGPQQLKKYPAASLVNISWLSIECTGLLYKNNGFSGWARSPHVEQGFLGPAGTGDACQIVQRADADGSRVCCCQYNTRSRKDRCIIGYLQASHILII